VDLQLSDRVFIVTGGSRGLGLGTAQVLVDEGAAVVLSSRSQDHVSAAVERLGSRAVGVAADLTDAATPGLLIAAALEHFGALHGAFVSHGGPPPGSASALSDDDLKRSLELATVAPIRFVRDIVDELDQGGAIVVLTSSSTVQPIDGLAGSNLARPAVWGYCKTLAAEVAPRGVRINVLLPGRFATERVDELDAARARAESRDPAAVRREHEQQVPLRRLGDPLELGRVAAFLLSPAASYVTGAAWAVDGGSIQGL